MANRNRDKRQKRRRRKKIKAPVRNALFIIAGILVLCLYVGYQAYMRANESDIWGAVGKQELEDDETFTITNGTASYTVFDVGKGEAILVQRNGVEALIDTGPKDGAEALCSKLKDLIHGDLEYLVLSSPSDGRVGGLEEIFDNFKIKNCIIGEMGDKESYVWRQTSRAENIINGENLSFDVGKDATLFVLKPEVSSEDPLDRSLVSFFKFGETGFLALSDAGKEEISRAFGSVSDVKVLTLSRNGDAKINKDILSSRYDFTIASDVRTGDAANGALSDVVTRNLLVTGILSDLEFVSDGRDVSLVDEEAKKEIINNIKAKERAAKREAERKVAEEEKEKKKNEAEASEGGAEETAAQE